jgi:hypothetical protein
MPKITHFHEIARFSSFRDVVPGNVSLRGNSFLCAGDGLIYDKL